MHAQHLGQLKADGIDRVERAHWVLEDHGHVLATDALPVGQSQAQERAPLKLQPGLRTDAPVMPGQEPHHR